MTGGTRARNKHSALLKGLLVCKACDRTMTHTFTGKGNKRYRYYTCTNAIKNGRKSCPTRSLPAAEIEQTVMEQLREVVTNERLREEVFEQIQTRTDDEIQKLRTEQSRLNRKLKRHNDDLKRTIGDNTESAKIVTADLNERIEKARSRLVEVTNRIEDLESDRFQQADVDEALDDFEAMWATLSPREQIQALALVIEKIEFDHTDDSIEIEFNENLVAELSEQRCGAAA